MTSTPNTNPIIAALSQLPSDVRVAPDPEILPGEDVVDRDFEYARKNLYDVIEKGISALEDLGQIAQASQHPRAFEVFATMTKAILDANKDLLALSKQKKDIKGEEIQPIGDTHNHLYVGTTRELKNMLRQARDQIDEEDTED